MSDLPEINEQQVNDYLQAFDQNPVDTMQSHPPKMDKDGNPVQGNSVFSQQDIDSQRYIDVRDAFRQSVYRKEEISNDRAAYQANDRAVDLVDSFTLDTLEAMEAADLKAASLDESPWSDDYWAIYRGVLGARYGDPHYPHSEDWQTNFNYIRDNHPRAIFNSGNTTAINLLSPSEKYDALVGDINGTLTRRMWSDGKYYYDASGKVETWMGICHGWAPAAYMLNRPTGTVTAPAANGTNITFYPSDIKSLASLLWANASSATRFIGGRCNDKDPAIDPHTGRVTSSQCYDTNPGTWHMAVVNQLGVARRSMVLDVTYDYEVWNQPLYAYQYRYVNPQTRQQTHSLQDATVSMADFTSDKFRQYRSDRAAAVVGIAMRVAYVVETDPHQGTTDNPDQDAIQQVDYFYDLELDSSGKIIGGEWYNNTHPDFLWTPPKGARAETRYDGMATGSWGNDSPVPQSWMIAARQSSQTDGSPLAAVVERLIDLSNS